MYLAILPRSTQLATYKETIGTGEIKIDPDIKCYANGSWCSTVKQVCTVSVAAGKGMSTPVLGSDSNDQSREIH